MSLIVLATAVLVIGALAALAVSTNAAAAACAIGSQAVATILTLAAVLPVLFGAPDVAGQFSWSYPVDVIAIRADALSAMFLAFSLPLTLLGTIYARGYLSAHPTRHMGTHFALLNLTQISFLMIYTLENAMAFLLGWEIAALAAWLLVIWDYRNQKIRFAGFNYLVSTHLSVLFLIAAFMVMHSAVGSYDFQAFHQFLASPSPARNSTFLLLLASFGLKSAFFPFHTWLPRAHSAAPAHVSALMSGVIHKAGLYALLRFTLLLGTPDRWMAWTLLLFSTLSAVTGALYTISQRDLKRLLGYSSTENVGIIGIGFGVGYLGLVTQTPILVALGFGGGLLHIVNHALFKCLLFYGAGCIARQTHTVDLERLGGLMKRMPYTGLFFIIGGLASAALPPLNGFVSEFLIYAGLLKGGAFDVGSRAALLVVAAALALTGGLSMLSIVRAIGIAFLGHARDPHIHAPKEAPRSMLAPMGVLLTAIVVLGAIPSAGLALVAWPVRLFGMLPPAAVGGGVSTGTLLEDLLSLLAPVSVITGGLVGAFMIAAFVRSLLLPRADRRHVTWSCGYRQLTSRMQYTGSSFSDQAAHAFRFVLHFLRREHLPTGPFPKGGFLNTHCMDAVERRMFKVLGEGESMVVRFVRRLADSPASTALSFAVGLVALLIAIGLEAL